MEQYRSKIVHYDCLRRRLWIRGQRCHHGAAGALVATVALVAEPLLQQEARTLPLLAVAAGGALMVHDWKDKSIWFQRGYGPEA